MSHNPFRRFASLQIAGLGLGWCVAGVVAVWLAFWTASLHAQEVTLAWKLRPGEVFYLLFDTEAKTDTVIKDQTINQRMRLVMLYRYQVLEATANGYVLEQTVEEVATDSRDFLGGLALQMRGVKLKVHTDRNFKVTKLEGHAELAKRIGADDPVVGKALQELVSESALREQIQAEFNFLPDKPVRRGDKWDRQLQIPAGPLGTFTLRQTLTYEGTETRDGKVLDRISGVASTTYAPPKPDAELPVRVSKGELLASDWKGTHWFDREAGRLVASEGIARYKLRLTLTPAGTKPGQASLDFTMDIAQEVKTRTQVSTDRPQLPKLESH